MIQIYFTNSRKWEELLNWQFYNDILYRQISKSMVLMNQVTAL